MCVVDFDPPLFYSETSRRSRSGFKCSECARAFPPRTRHSHTSAMYERRGRVYVYRRCLDCAALADAVDAADCSWAHGSLLDDAAQTLSPWGDHADADPVALGTVAGLLFRIREESVTAAGGFCASIPTFVMVIA